MAFALYAALRIPTEIRHLKWSDFNKVVVNGHTYEIFMVADKSKGTKTGLRPVPVIPLLLPYVDTLRSLAKPGQEYVFEKYRNHSNIISAIYDDLERAGVVEKGEKAWEKFESVDKFIHYVILCFWLFFTGVMDVGVQEMWR